MSVYTAPAFDAHENVLFGFDEETGLRAIIAIHNTNLGPAVGGCRMWPYADEAAALEDALRRGVEVEVEAAVEFLDRGHQLWVPTSERSRSQGSAITDTPPDYLMEQQ